MGTQVTLKATPDANSVFASWGGACKNQGKGDCALAMTAARKVSAKFKRK
jgi:hypothetical protein